MSPQLALYLGYGLILWLLMRDRRQRRADSWALLIPAAWIAICSSRPVGYWLGADTDGVGDGGSINIIVQGFLMASAVVILARRGLSWSQVARHNKALFAIYLYFLVSMTWSHDPVSTTKRVVKDFGCVIMALVLLTETDPVKSMRILFVRLSYILFTLSLVYIKYFPSIGRSASKSGEAMFTGVTMQKNSLGLLVLVFSFFLILDLIEMRREERDGNLKLERRIRYLMLLMGGWLLYTCNSQTSLVCFLLGGAILIWSRWLMKTLNPRAVLYRFVAVAVVAFVVEKTFHVSEAVVTLLGRDMTFTGRTEIWNAVLAQDTNPLIGCGFYSFWDGPFGQKVFTRLGEAYYGTETIINTAHNGYIEVYVDGGYIGVALLLILLLVAFRNTLEAMLAGSLYGRFCFMFVVIAVVYNNSEADFFRLEVLWQVLLISMIDWAGIGREWLTADPVVDPEWEAEQEYAA